MKKITAFVIFLILTLSLASCSCRKTNVYEPIESTEEEARAVMTLTAGDKTYDVRYELYRAFFLTYKSTVDGGDASVWTGDNKDDYINEINALITEQICEIYSVFALCDEIGFDIYSKDVENEITEAVRVGVEGGEYNGVTFTGYGGDYDKYLASLKEMGLNYSVQALLLRYSIAVDAIQEYYIGTRSADDITPDMGVGCISYTEADIRSFYYSDECARVYRAFFGADSNDEEHAVWLKSRIEEAAASADSPEDKDSAVFSIIMNSTMLTPSEVENGYIIGRYNLDSLYDEMTEQAFSIEQGQTSDYFRITTSDEDNYYVLYSLAKSDEHLADRYSEIEYVYLTNYVGKILHGIEVKLNSSVSYTSAYDSISHAEIGM